MPFDQHNLKEETFLAVGKIILGIIFAGIAKYSWRGVVFTYIYYQERKDKTVTYIITFRKQFWGFLILIAALAAYVIVQNISTSATMNASMRYVLGNAETTKEMSNDIKTIKQQLKYLLEIDSLRKIK